MTGKLVRGFESPSLRWLATYDHSVSHPTVSVHADIPDGLPGRELIVAGLDDLRAGRDTVEAMLVATGAPRLRACGI